MNLYKPKNKNYWHFAPMLNCGASRKQQEINTYATDKRVAQEILRKTQLLAEAVEAQIPLTPELRQWLSSMNVKLRQRLTRIGLISDRDAASLNDIQQHMNDYIQASRFEGQCDGHVKIKTSHLRRIIEATGARRLTDLTTERVATCLRSLQDGNRGNRTVNQHRASVIAWLNWCVKNGRLDHHGLDRIPRLNEDLDRRRHRRAATPEEVVRFLAAAPPRRKFIYQVAMYTGLRRGEMNQIERRDIDLKADTLTVRAEVGKTRKPVTLPLHADVVELLRDHIADMNPSDRVFKPVPHIETFKYDLAAAGIPFKDDNDRQLDFHALRSTFATLLLRNGVQPAVARRLTRHSSVKTLEKHYDKLGLADAADAIKQLPGFNRDGGEQPSTPPPSGSKNGSS